MPPLVPVLAAAALLFGVGSDAIQLEDVPQFVARCKVDSEARPPPGPLSSYYFGGIFSAAIAIGG
jgi:hypothetical protein